MSKPEHSITLEIENRQRNVTLDLPKIQSYVENAITACFAAASLHDKCGKLPETIEASIVSDRAIAKIHRDFMNIPGPTDVITFPYGEIIVSAQTAETNASAHHLSLEQELSLYFIHGILHLLGFDDKDPKDASLMHHEQEKILKAVCEKM